MVLVISHVNVKMVFSFTSQGNYDTELVSSCEMLC